MENSTNGGGGHFATGWGQFAMDNRQHKWGTFCHWMGVVSLDFSFCNVCAPFCHMMGAVCPRNTSMWADAFVMRQGQLTQMCGAVGGSPHDAQIVPKGGIEL